ncbi:MAG: molybdopterin-dependent oxidoreductase [Pseudomonadota bacterium]|nr:molybdopterin-dependent oxidoreductase [Pseudomonadota bacterium]
MQEDRKISRRTFLAGTGGAIVSIGLPGVFIKLADAKQRALAADTRPDGRPRLPPGQLAVERIRDMGGAPGTATIANWTLRVHDGEVEKSIVFSYQDLLNLDQVQITCDIHCVTGWTLLDSRWGGVRLTTIMDRVRPHRSAGFVIFEAAGDYTSNIPMSEARKGDVILAHSFFGEKLQQAHGAPVRALIPDRYFYKSAKWMEAVKITSRDEPGF